MSVKITDCTIRDGGYLLNKNSDPEFVKGVLAGLAKAGIDFAETGFLQTKVNGETIVYHNSKDVIKYLPKDWGNTNYLGFCDNSRYSPDDLDEYDGTSFKWLRISFAKHEIDDSLEFCKKAMDKGYLVQFNPMDQISYTEEERESLLKKINGVKPACVSIVDTFGAMYMDDLDEIFGQFDAALDKSIMIGLHSHDNLGLSCGLAEHMIRIADKSGRAISVHGSLFGMRRGAGNAYTELLADYINKKCGGHYNIPALLETIDRYIVQLTKDVHWGYDLPMYICGTMHSHVDNVYHLQKAYGSTPEEMYEVINDLEPAKRTRYGKGYSKTDFTVLDETYARRNEK